MNETEIKIKASLFWSWFKSQEKHYFDELESNTKELLEVLIAKVQEVDERLTFEISPVQESGKRHFILSAGGIMETFPIILVLESSAPALDHWEVVAFRQRKEVPSVVQFGDFKMDIKDIFFDYEINEGRFDLTVFIRDYDKQPIYEQGAFLFLDALLGEFDVETKIGEIHFKGTAIGTERTHNLVDLPLFVDTYFDHQSDE